MRYRAMLLAVPVALAACAADGTFKSPGDLTPAERCYNLELGYALASANGASASFLARMRANIDLLCPAAPPSIAAEAKAEAAETVSP